LGGRLRIDQGQLQAPDDVSVAPFLKRLDTSSQGLTLGLCDSLARRLSHKVASAKTLQVDGSVCSAAE